MSEKIETIPQIDSPFKSQFDPTRENVGKTYRDIALANKESYVINGDLTNELTKSLVDDINEAIQSNPFQDRQFYITIVEKKDLAMPRAIHRELFKSIYRPWPEYNTVVFWVDPKACDVRFCWCLPHYPEMDNFLKNAHLYDNDFIQNIRAWKNVDLHRFGFVKIGIGDKWIPNDKWIDKPLTKTKPKGCEIIKPVSF